MDVVQLHNHSEYSILDGRSRLEELVVRVKEMGQEAVALTDHGSMYGTMEFYRVAKRHGVKPILGVEAYVAAGPMRRKDPVLDKAGSSSHLTILAESEVGYRSMLKLVSKAHMEGFYYRPRIDFEALVEHGDGLVILSGCMGGEVSQLVLKQQYAEAEAVIARYREAFGPDRYFLEIHEHGLEKQKRLNPWMIDAAKRFDVQLVAACDSHYVRREDAKSHDVLLAIQTGSVLADPGRFKVEPYGEYYVKSGEEMAVLFGGVEYAVANTMGVSERCNVNLDKVEVQLPVFALPEGQTADTWLRRQVVEGLKWRYGVEIPGNIIDRAKHELTVIGKTGYAKYFLIVQDYVRHARSQGVMAVPRGSVAGSLCVYALGICDIDPMKYDIMFERFLHEERKGMPDVDMDFADNRRDDVIAYVTEKYGSDRVAHIGTFSTLGARAAVKDVARVLGVDFAETNRLTRAFPAKIDLTVAEAWATEAVQEAVRENPVYAEVMEIAGQLEGMVRGFGTHAAGILIAATALDEVVPIQLPPGGKKGVATAVTQYDNNNATAVIESIGLSKFDFLGLANLTVIRDACLRIRARQGIDLYGESGEKLYSGLPFGYEDPLAKRTYDMLGQGETTAVFQLESAGMRRALRMVKPTRITDLPAIVALFRPGPMENIPVFAAAKNNPDMVPFYDDRVTPFLAETYGVVVYQDQVLLLARELAGFTWGEVDVLRKGMGKKQVAVINEQREKFLRGCAGRGFSQELAETVWETMAPFAGYGFNKAHACCYGVVAYITAFLKANFPTEYMAAVLTQESGNKEKVYEAVTECRRLGVQVLPPDVRESGEGFTITGPKSVRFGFGAIANVGEGMIRRILVSNRDWKTFKAFLKEVPLNSRAATMMVKSGACDSFGERNRLLAAIPGLLETTRKDHGFQMDMFGAELDAELPDAPPMVPEARLACEKEAMGLYVSGHPLDAIRPVLDKHATHSTFTLPEDDDRVVLGGMVRNVRYHRQKNGKRMAFFVLEDMFGEIDVVAFARQYEACEDLICSDTLVLVSGDLRYRDEKPSLIVNKMTAIVMKKE